MSANNTENRKFSKNKNKPRQPRWDNDAHNLLSDARGADALRELRALGRPHQFGGKPRSMLPSFSKQLVDPNNYGEEGVDQVWRHLFQVHEKSFFVVKIAHDAAVAGVNRCHQG